MAIKRLCLKETLSILPASQWCQGIIFQRPKSSSDPTVQMVKNPLAKKASNAGCLAVKGLMRKITIIKDVEERSAAREREKRREFKKRKIKS